MVKNHQVLPYKIDNGIDTGPIIASKYKIHRNTNAFQTTIN